MKALVFRHNLAREAVSAVGGRVDRHAFVSRLAPVRLEDVDELPLPAQDWVRVETTFSGLCGSDVKQILLNGSRDNPLTALVSFPHVLGHEVVGRRADTGERVVLNPWLSCTPRGIDPPCQACRAGRYPWCRNFRSGDLPVSIHIGNCAAAAGAHAERFGAHVSQLFAIPDDVSDEAAVLADPSAFRCARSCSRRLRGRPCWSTVRARSRSRSSRCSATCIPAPRCGRRPGRARGPRSRPGSARTPCCPPRPTSSSRRSHGASARRR